MDAASAKLNKGNYMRLSFLLVLLALFFSHGCCQKTEPAAKKDVIAYVNKDPIYKSDLKREIAVKAKSDPAFKVSPGTESDQLDVIIDKKLIVQYAMEKGLARQERFVNTIRNIWEHALIRDCIDYKKREFQDYLFATDDEIKEYYANMSKKVSFKVLRTKDKQKIEDAYQKYLKDKDTTGWQAVGPLDYEDVSSGILFDAFGMEKGAARIFEDASHYYLIEVSDKEEAQAPPLQSIKKDVEKRVIEMKEKRLFEDWLNDLRKKSWIKVIGS